MSIPRKGEPQPYTFAQLKNFAKPNKDKKIPKSHDLYCTKDNKSVWIFTRSEEYVKYPERFEYSGCKIHFNIQNPTDIAKSYDAIAKIRLKYKKFFPVSKVLDFEMLRVDYKTQKKLADGHPLFPNALSYDAIDGKIYLRENAEKVSKRQYIHIL